MPRRPRQPRAPQPNGSGNAFQALVDLPKDGFDSTFDGRDDILDVWDDPTPTTGYSPAFRIEMIESITRGCQSHLWEVSNGDSDAHRCIISKLDTLLTCVTAVNTDNKVLCTAYSTSREETAALKAAVDNLTRRFDDHIAISAPPSPDTMASSTSMEEMTITDYQDHAPRSSHRHSRTVDLRHDCSHGICYL
jgi:hypothetical protein